MTPPKPTTSQTATSATSPRNDPIPVDARLQTPGAAVVPLHEDLDLVDMEDRAPRMDSGTCFHELDPVPLVEDSAVMAFRGRRVVLHSNSGHRHRPWEA